MVDYCHRRDAPSMIKIKRLDSFILGKFLQLFVGAFFICLFVFMMQFTWRWINDLVGKGLTLDILGQFFWYMGITLVPTALPLAILLAALITFGNMGENLELLSMKAAGVPLVRIMAPIFCVVVPLMGVSFYFQNTVSPDAQKGLGTLATSIKISQPAVQIPEGVFYNGIPNTNIYVERKNTQTGMLYHTIIYKTDQGFDRAQIVLADSARLEMTADKLHLRLTLWAGEQFQSLKADNAGNVFDPQSEPYDRETFAYKQILIDFDSNFTQLDADQLGSMPQAKNMGEIVHDVDSMNHVLDSTALSYFKETLQRQNFAAAASWTKADSLRAVKDFRKHPFSIDEVIKKTPKDRLQAARQQASARLQTLSAELDWQSETVQSQEHYIRLHWIEWHQKITLSLACLLFFFIGAPLGAIIRKGGLGMPTVVSVAIFIIYYVINISSMKSARAGTLNMFVGMWLSTFVLAPAGAYLTYMANRDSTVFNLDAYLALLRRLLGLRTKRNLFRKEVIIEAPDYAADLRRLRHIRAAATAYNKEKRLLLAPGYFRIFFRTRPDERMEQLSNDIEAVVGDLANTRSPQVLAVLNDIPTIYAHAHTTPFVRKRYNWTFGVIFPLGLLLWVRIWRFRLRLFTDLRQVVKCCERLESLLANPSNLQ
jgi:putative permease